jgi:N-acetylated-alpha-linked acidic dipeptidase
MVIFLFFAFGVPRSNHRLAWVMGAADPTSGTVSLHEVIKGFGALVRTGWKPLRTGI